MGFKTVSAEMSSCRAFSMIGWEMASDRRGVCPVSFTQAQVVWISCRVPWQTKEEGVRKSR